jgi:hypothetical protein
LEVTVDTSKDNAPRVSPKDPAPRLTKLEERLRQEFLGEEERCELADRVVRLRHRLGF